MSQYQQQQRASEYLFSEAKKARAEGRCPEAIEILESAGRFARRVFEHQPEYDLHAAWAAVNAYAAAFPDAGWAQFEPADVEANAATLEALYNSAHVCAVCVALEIGDAAVFVRVTWGACEREPGEDG